MLEALPTLRAKLVKIGARMCATGGASRSCQKDIMISWLAAVADLVFRYVEAGLPERAQDEGALSDPFLRGADFELAPHRLRHQDL